MNMQNRADALGIYTGDIEMKPVSSSQIKAIGYHRDSKTLAIEFHSSAPVQYRYAGVEQGVADELVQADSIGRYFGRHIKNDVEKYPFVKMRPDDAEERRLKTHTVRCWSDVFPSIMSRDRQFDIRRNDREYAVGDLIEFQEWDDRRQMMTGRVARRYITYVMDVRTLPVEIRNRLGMNPSMMPDDLVILSVK